MMAPETYLVYAVGCKVNQYEAQQLREALDYYGLEPAEVGQVPDWAVVNTCAVTQTAARKSRQLVRRATHQGNTRVIVVGCAAVVEAERYRQIDGVVGVITHDDDWDTQLSVVLGAGQKQCPYNELSAVTQKTSSPAGIEGPTTGGAGRRGTADTEPMVEAARGSDDSIQIKAPEDGQVKWTLGGTIHGLAGHHRAFLKVQDGCDAACTYCIIPQLRRGLRSKPIEVAVREARDLVANGYKEIVITGVFLGAYGRSTARMGRRKDSRPVSSPLARLLEALAGVAGLVRVRLSSLEPNDVTDDLLDVMGRCDACAPHLHLPLQAGSDAVLRRMNRQYRIDDYLATIDRVRDRLDRPAVTTDVIVGFPGETEEDFERTLGVVERVGFARVHAFPFSLRAGTVAERWRGEMLGEAVVRERMRRLRSLADEAELAFRRRFIGQVERVIVETRRGAGWEGRGDRYFPVRFPAPAQRDLCGRAVEVAIQLVKDSVVRGVLRGT
ncbi:MAG: MiaB/RimO family radical SAM methylthiotransferase [Phycisphaerae bacterium]|nr:MiaB/RimO family radical SAM methylthiotransferase [Phycisphaerae bacterium]